MTDDTSRPRNGKLWGGRAAKARDFITAFDAAEKAKPKREAEPEAPKSVFTESPQTALVAARLRRFKPMVKAYCSNYCMRLIPRQDLFAAVRTSSSKLLNDARNMSKVALTRRKIHEIVDRIVLGMEGVLEGVSDRQVGIEYIEPLMGVVMGGLGEAFSARIAMTDEQRIAEAREQEGAGLIKTPAQRSLSGLLAQLPPEMAEKIRQRLYAIGINPNDEKSLKFLIRNLGVNPDEAMEQLRNGEIPEKLKGFF